MFLPFYTVYFFSSQSIIVRLLLLLYGPTWRQFVNGRLLWNSQFHSGRMRESWWIERWSRQPSLTDIHHFLVAALIVVCCFVLNFVLVCFLFFSTRRTKDKLCLTTRETWTCRRWQTTSSVPRANSSKDYEREVYFFPGTGSKLRHNTASFPAFRNSFRKRVHKCPSK